MTTEGRAVGQEVGIVDRGRGEGSGQHKAVAGVHCGMFLQPEVRGIIFDHPVGFEIAGELLSNLLSCPDVWANALP